MKTYKQFLSEQELLTEKLLLINNGKKYGQIVILAGGAGSGKGFASANFMNNRDYKVRDVDEVKKSYIKLAKATGKYPEIANLDLKNPKDVSAIHQFVKNTGNKDKTLKSLLAANTNPATLPNILFDVTLDDMKKIGKILPNLLGAGYLSENIHLVWVLTDYKVAVMQNKKRDRIVPDDVLLQTHEGAANTMWDIIGKRNIPKDLDGGIYVILNNRKNTVFFTDEDGKDFRKSPHNPDATERKTNIKQKWGSEDLKGEKNKIIKDFKYLTFKKPKKSPITNAKIKLQLWAWITNNIPMTDLTAKIWAGE